MMSQRCFAFEATLRRAAAVVILPMHPVGLYRRSAQHTMDEVIDSIAQPLVARRKMLSRSTLQVAMHFFGQSSTTACAVCRTMIRLRGFDACLSG